jgi:tryptophan synthase alpha chain
LSDPGAIGRAWAELRRTGRTALIPYLTAGHPDRGTSLAALRVAAEFGDLLEVGVPFSDPLADGPTIQRSSFEALRHGMTLAGTLALIEELRSPRPVILFSYLNPVLHYGVERLCRDAARAGVSGILLTDLPAGADRTIEEAVAASPLDLIPLVAPTSNPDRIAAAARGARGFIYLIGRLGVTGAGTAPDADLAATVAAVRAATPLPVVVGFGVATAEQARAAGRMADGVVVGSALVEALAGGGIAGLRRRLEELRMALEGALR